MEGFEVLSDQRPLLYNGRELYAFNSYKDCSGFQVSGSKFQVWSLELQVSGLEFESSSYWFQTSRFGCGDEVDVARAIWSLKAL